MNCKKRLKESLKENSTWKIIIQKNKTHLYLKKKNITLGIRALKKTLEMRFLMLVAKNFFD